MIKYKAIIFDMDGTIVATEHLWFEANKCLLEGKGMQYTPELEAEVRKRLHGLSLEKSCEILKQIANLQESVEDLMNEQLKCVQELYKKGISFIEGFESFHAQVVQRELKSGVATNADDHTLKVTKETLYLEKFFGEHIYNISYVNNMPKPDPAIYLYVAHKLGLHPSECIAIEDSAHGIKAAKKSGMLCIGINTSDSYEQVEESDLIVENYKDLDLQHLLS